MFDFRSHNRLGTRIGVMTHWQDAHPRVKFHFGGAVLRSLSNTGRLAMCSYSKRQRWRRRQRTATPSRRSPFFNAATTPRVGGAEDDLSLLLCQPRPTCLHLSLAYEALSHHVCEHSRRGHTAATSIIAGPPSEQEQVRCIPRLRRSSMHLKRSRSGDTCKCRAPSPWAKLCPLSLYAA